MIRPYVESPVFWTEHAGVNLERVSLASSPVTAGEPVSPPVTVVEGGHEHVLVGLLQVVLGAPLVVHEVAITVVHAIRPCTRPRHVYKGDISIAPTLHVAQVNIVVEMSLVKSKLRSIRTFSIIARRGVLPGPTCQAHSGLYTW